MKTGMFQISQRLTHLIVTQLSPIKESRKNKRIKYFNSQVTDGKKTARAISFDPTLWSAFKESLDGKKPLQLTNCSIKKTRDTFEIFANAQSRVTQSPKKFC